MEERDIHVTMPKKSAAELSEYEMQRQENIAKNQALLQKLQLEAASAGLAPSKPKAPSSTADSKNAKKRKAPVQKVKEEVVPRRTSSRLKGIVADSEVARQKAEQEAELLAQADRAKRQRKSEDLRFSDVVVAGKDWDQSGNFLRLVGPANPGERTFSAQDVKDTTDKELKELRERMSGLELWEGFEPNSMFALVLSMLSRNTNKFKRDKDYTRTNLLSWFPPNQRQSPRLCRRQTRQSRPLRRLPTTHSSQA